MKSSSLLHFMSGLAFAATLAGCAGTAQLPSNAARVEIASTMPVGGEVMAPVGFIGFCIRNRTACEGGTDTPMTPMLTPALWSELNAVNEYVNRLPQIADGTNYNAREYWAYPNARGGDCEDLALEKRRLLIRRGFPSEALLLATARETDGTLHAVLVAVTDEGEFVLDNRNWVIVPWNEAPYAWKVRQSRERPYMWVNLDVKSRATARAKLPPLGAPAPFLAFARGAERKQRIPETVTSSF